MKNFTIQLAALLAAMATACTVEVSDGPVGDVGGFGGFGGFGGDGGTAGSTAGGGSGGGAMAGSGGSASGGTGGMSEPDAGLFPAPTCEAAAGDDDCIACLKASCCDAWLQCDDALCDEEWSSVASCTLAVEDPDEDDYQQCVSDNAMGGLPAMNTLGVLECINTESSPDAGAGLTLCGQVCFGADILFL